MEKTKAVPMNLNFFFCPILIVISVLDKSQPHHMQIHILSPQVNISTSYGYGTVLWNCTFLLWWSCADQKAIEPLSWVQNRSVLYVNSRLEQNIISIFAQIYAETRFMCCCCPSSTRFTRRWRLHRRMSRTKPFDQRLCRSVVISEPRPTNMNNHDAMMTKEEEKNHRNCLYFFCYSTSLPPTVWSPHFPPNQIQ